MELYYSNMFNKFYVIIYYFIYLGLFNVLVVWIFVNFYVFEFDFIFLINNDFNFIGLFYFLNFSV